MSTQSILSPQVVARVREFLVELHDVSKQLSFQADFGYVTREFTMLNACVEELNSCRFAMSESANVNTDPDAHDEDVCPLGKPCYYLLPQSFHRLERVLSITEPVLRAIGARAQKDGERLAYDYLAYMLKRHKETALYLLATIQDELLPLEDFEKQQNRLIQMM